MLIISGILDSCKKNTQVDMNLETRTYGSIDSITMTSAYLRGGTWHTLGLTAPTIFCKFYISSTSNEPSEKDNMIQAQMNLTDNSRFGAKVSGLTPNTKYYVKIFAGDKYGTGSALLAFTTLSETPIVTTNYVLEYSRNSAVLGGQIATQGPGQITDYGVFLSLFHAPVSGTKYPVTIGSSNFSIEISGLLPRTTYYVIAYAQNKYGTGFGSEVTFNTGEDSTKSIIYDIDNNIYHYIKVGHQVWMAENLKVQRLNDGTEIPLIGDGLLWSSTSKPADCWYNNNDSIKNIYGALYNWNCVNTAKICPTGWHVPSLDEWKTLGNYTGGENVAGAKLKEAGIVHWTNSSGVFRLDSNFGSTNETGFTALPGGARSPTGFVGICTTGEWWTSTKAFYPDSSAYRFFLRSDHEILYREPLPFNYGASIRCIKD